jgi:hypothetical protein
MVILSFGFENQKKIKNHYSGNFFGNSTEQIENTSDDSGNTFDKFGITKTEHLFMGERSPIERASQGISFRDQNGYFAKKNIPRANGHFGKKFPLSSEQNHLSLYDTNKTEKQFMGEQKSLYQNHLHSNPNIDKRIISKEDINNTLISTDSMQRGSQKKNNIMRRSVQNKIRQKKGYDINFSLRKKKQPPRVPMRQLEKDLGKISSSKRDALEELSNYSSRTTDIQKKIKANTKRQRQRNTRKSRGVSNGNRLNLRKSMVSRSPKGNIKIQYRPVKRGSSTNSMTRVFRTNPVKVNVPKNSNSMMIDIQKRDSSSIIQSKLSNKVEKVPKHTSIFGDFIDDKKSQKVELSRKGLSKKVSIIGKGTQNQPEKILKDSSHPDSKVEELERKIKKLEQEKKEVQEMCDFYKIQEKDGEKVKLLEEEIEKLKKDIVQLKETISMIQSEKGELRIRINELTTELRDKEEYYQKESRKKKKEHEEVENELKRELNSLDETLKKLKKKMNEEWWNEDLNNLEDLPEEQQIKKMKMKIRVLEKEKEFLIKEKKRLVKSQTPSQEVSMKSVRIDEDLKIEYKEKIQNLESIVEQLKKENNDQEQLKNDWEKEKEELAKKIQNIMNEKEFLNRDWRSKLGKEQFRIKEMEIENEELKTKIGKLKNTIEDQQEVEKLEEKEELNREEVFMKRVQLLKDQIKSNENDHFKEVEVLQKRLKEKDLELISKEEKEDISKKELVNLKKDKEMLQKKIIRLESEIEILKESKQQNNHKFQEAQENVGGLQMKVELLESELKTKNESLDRFQKEVDNERIKSEDYQNKIKQLDEEIEIGKKENSKLKDKLKESEMKCNTLKTESTQISKELEVLKEKIQMESENLEDKTEVLQYENDKLKKNLKMMELKISTLKSSEKSLSKKNQIVEKQLKSLENKAHQADLLEKEQIILKNNLKKSEETYKILQKSYQKSMMKIGNAMNLLNTLKLKPKQQDKLMNVLVNG